MTQKDFINKALALAEQYKEDEIAGCEVDTEYAYELLMKYRFGDDVFSKTPFTD